MHNLCREELWLPYGTLRSHICKTMRGGLSEVAAYVVRSFFGNVDENFGTDGVVLAIEGEHFVLYLTLTNIVADDEALTKIFATKGASAILPCLSCKNVLSAGRDCQNSDYFVTVACPDVKRFDCCSDQDFVDRMDAVNAARTAWDNRTGLKKDYETAEKNNGHAKLFKSYREGVKDGEQKRDFI